MNKQGFFLFGTLKGFRTDTRVANGKTYVNYKLGIARVFEGNYGDMNEDLLEVDVLQDDSNRIEQQAASLKGKPVVVEVVPRARPGGRQGAWLSMFMPKGTDIQLQKLPPVAPAKAV